MNFDLKTLIKIALGLGIALAAVYFALPASHTFLWAAAPFLLFLGCPIAMIFMMKSMNCTTEEKSAKDDKGSANSLLDEPRSDKT
ncbi:MULTISPECIES: DUF2933 domain-containing protein [Variovorax]|jgi:hypothetical protein|uniref:DUF2933 domain-containing protein n=1 Tax=Variovorax sp. 3P27G3 TaxID=2502214 RepID=UPI0010F509CF|nr:DUF2933 domain-containing protein [Variovorax sp. 3P27G3]